MYRRLLVPVDLSGRSHGALAVARQLALPAQGEITLLHVIETIEGFEDEDLESFYFRLEQRARRVLEELASQVPPAGPTVRTEVTYGRRDREIVAFAERHGHDLIVMGSHRMDLGHPGVGWPTLSHRVAILAQCPVLLVR